jgi:predicted acylesterase/phospholipase RssA
MKETNEMSASPACVTDAAPGRIGLALSGGGFRASIFHLGVIRRLEELGIMGDIDVVSTVSGGSIIGAYYLCQWSSDCARSSRRGSTTPPSG